METMKVALLGQPNTGKSTLFNQLTGMNQHVGNWPGKTVEQKTGKMNYKGKNLEFIDLPGTYSLTANSDEERIARDYVLKERSDLVVVMVDASQLERSLYILSEALYMDTPVVAALSMIDVAEKKGIAIDIKKIEFATGVKFFPMNVTSKDSVDPLKNFIAETNWQKFECKPKLPEFSDETVGAAERIRELVSQRDLEYPIEWTVVKLLEEDGDVLHSITDKGLRRDIEEVLRKVSDGLLVTADMRYTWINTLTTEAVVYSSGHEYRICKFDKYATHPVLGPVIGILSMFLSIVVAMILAAPLMFGGMSLIPVISGGVTTLLSGVAAPSWLVSALASGLVPGIMFPLSMVFFMAGVYLVIGFLEDVGYMARLAYVNDGFMERMGMTGKSFFPMLLSVVCNISGVLGTRVIDSWRQRLLTMVVSLLVPCLGIWAVTGFIATLFFGKSAGLVLLSLIIVMVVYMFVLSLMLRKTVIKDTKHGIIMELPPYHKPNWKTIWRYTYTHSLGFIKKAGIYMAGIVLLIWAFSYFPGGSINDSYLAYFGKILAPVGNLMGMDWRLLTCLLIGFFSKEAVIACIAVLFGLSEVGGISIIDAMLHGVVYNQADVGNLLLTSINPHTALAFIFALFFSLPCQATAMVVYHETASVKWTLGIVGYFAASSIVMGILSYNVSMLMF